MEMLWRGTLAFELVHVPIQLLQATRPRRLSFRLLHEPDLAPIRNVRVCSEEETPVEADEIVRGYEVDGEWVVVTDEEIERAAPHRTRTVVIQEFVDLHEIDPILFRKPYYLAPDEGGEDLYVMMREALRRSAKVGIAQFVLLHREHLAALRVVGDALVLETMHYPEELIPERELALPTETRLREGEIRMAVELIENLSRPFDPTRYRNRYRAELLEVIRKKAKGELPPELEPPPIPEPTSVVDLTRRLRESLERRRAESERRAA